MLIHQIVILFLLCSIVSSYFVPPVLFGNTVRDLYSNSTNDMIMMGIKWVETFDAVFVTPDVNIGDFAGEPVLGGRGVIHPYYGDFERIYDQLPAHNMIYFDISVKVNDTWPFINVVSLNIADTWYNFYLNEPKDTDRAPGNPTVSVSHLIGKVPHTSSSLKIGFSYFINENRDYIDNWLAVKDISVSLRTESVLEEFTAITLLETTSIPKQYVYLRTNCSSGYFRNGGLCITCHASCQNCFGPSNTQCYSCAPGYSFVGNQCLQCPLNCAFCSGTNLGQCQLCKPGYKLDFDGTCTSSNTCKTSPFVIKTNSDVTLNTANSSAFCTQACPSGQSLLWNYTCTASCQLPLQQIISNGASLCQFPCNKTNNEYLHQNGSCLSSCSFNSVNETGYLFCGSFCQEYLYQNQSCLAICPAPYVAGVSLGVKTCNYPCSAGQYLYRNGTCGSTCPSLYTVRVENSSLFCEYPCASNEYLYNNGSCSSICLPNFDIISNGGDALCNYPCAIGSYLYDNGTCSETCPSGFIATGQGVYQFCSFSCPANSYLYANGSCLSSCESEYSVRIEGNSRYCYLNNTNSSNENPPVISPCYILLDYQNLMTTNCSNYDNACDPGYFQYQNGSCLQYCNDPFYAVLRNGSAYCYSPSSFPNNNTCLPETNHTGNGTNNITCPSGMYLSEDTCLNCAAPCNTCTGPQECLSCQSGYALINSSCISTCPDGSYLFEDFCYNCDVGCATCNGPQGCLSCQDGYILSNSSCIPLCPNGTYLFGDFCYNCTAPCETCTGLQECLSCQNGYKLFNSTCISTCPTGFYVDTPTESCLSCPSACETCTSPIECQSCISGYVLSNGTCNNDTSTPNNSTYNNGCSGVTFYKHQNGSCIATCPSPYVFLWKNNSAYCNSPCATGSYLSVNNTCITSCGVNEIPRIQDYLMFCDKINNTNSTNSTDPTNSPSVIVQIYIRYNISLVDFTSQDGLTKFVQQLATILGIDPSYIMIVSIREGSTIIESQISIASASDSGSMDTAKRFAENLGNKFSDAVATNNLNIINGVSILDYKNSIQVAKDTTGGNQIQVPGDSSSIGAIIGLAAGLAALALVVLTYAIYRYQKNSKLKAMKAVESTAKGETYKIEANMNQNNQEGKDDSLARITNGDVEIVKSRSNLGPNRLEEIDIRVEGDETNIKQEEHPVVDLGVYKEAQNLNLEPQNVRIERKVSTIHQNDQITHQFRGNSLNIQPDNEIDSGKQPSILQVSDFIKEIDIQIEDQVDKQGESQDQLGENIDIFMQADNQNVTQQVSHQEDDEKPISIGELMSQNL